VQRSLAAYWCAAVDITGDIVLDVTTFLDALDEPHYTFRVEWWPENGCAAWPSFPTSPVEKLADQQRRHGL
jgi:hypothetical protein